jgi:hypothetical protein
VIIYYLTQSQPDRPEALHSSGFFRDKTWRQVRHISMVRHKVIDDEENEAMEVVSLFLKLSWFP